MDCRATVETAVASTAEGAEMAAEASEAVVPEAAVTSHSLAQMRVNSLREFSGRPVRVGKAAH